MKKTFLILAIASLLSAIISFIAWSQNLLPDSGPHGENHDIWQFTIDLVWTIIPYGFGISLISFLIFALSKPRSKKTMIFAGMMIGVILLLTGGIFYIITHLGIQ